MRRALDRLYDLAAGAATICMLGILAMVLAGVVGRLAGFNLPGSDAYAGYCTAAAAFLGLAHTLKRGEHIRVALLLDRCGPGAHRVLDVIAHGAGALICTALASFSVRLAWLSHAFGDTSQASDATPLWIPQLAMAAGATVLAIAMLDEFVLQLVRRDTAANGPQASRPLPAE